MLNTRKIWRNDNRNIRKIPHMGDRNTVIIPITIPIEIIKINVIAVVKLLYFPLNSSIKADITKKKQEKNE